MMSCLYNRKTCLLDFLPPCVRNEAEWLALWEACYLVSVLPLFENYTPVCLSFTIHTKHFTSDTSGHQMCGDFSTTEPFSEIPAGCPIIQFNSNTNPSSRPQRWRTQSHKAVPHPRFRCKSQVIGPQVPHNFCLTWLPITGSWDLLWIWSFWNSSHYCFPVIKEYHKGYR